MKLAKSLFLGSVAGLAAVAGAQAADLPAKKAAAVEYVRVCSTYGAGFFYIPGTETCLRVGGRARAEFQYLEPTDRSQDAIGFRARGRIQLDARTATAYGLLRTFVRFEMTRDTGVYGFSSTSANVDQAFVQFGGLLAMAHEQGLLSLTARFITVEADLATAEATAVFEDGRRFTECGDASPGNVGDKVRPHFARMALTPAKARALRDALNIGMCSVEELSE